MIFFIVEKQYLSMIEGAFPYHGILLTRTAAGWYKARGCSEFLSCLIKFNNPLNAKPCSLYEEKE